MNDRKMVQKEFAKVVRDLMKFKGYDSSGCVRLYKDFAVECLVYGNLKMKNEIIGELRKLPQFQEVDCGFAWIDGFVKVYLTIV